MSNITPPLFIESLKVVNGIFIHPELHIKRIQQTQKEVFGESSIVQLEKEYIPIENRQGIQKCRIIYNQTIQQIEFSPYHPQPVHSLKCVDGTGIDYHLKYENRSTLTELLLQKGDCDDILIIQNNRITDTTYSNIVVFDGATYFTPNTYLLNGTKRQYLLQKDIIKELDIKVCDLKLFDSLYLINAMLDIEDGVRIEISDIK